MAEPYIIFRGVDSRELGVVIAESPSPPRPERSVLEFTVPGRSGALTIDEGTYADYDMKARINCFGVPSEDVFAWLDGRGWLVLGDCPDRAAWASVHEAVTTERLRCDGCYDTLTVTFRCSPYWYLQPPAADEVILQSPHTLENPTACSALPILKIEGDGDMTVSINGIPMAFSGVEGGIIVDSPRMECISLDGAQLLNDLASMDEFPVLQPGSNEITYSGGVQKITITPEWRML